MSNIIKAKQDARFEPYDFFEMEPSGQGGRPWPHASDVRQGGRQGSEIIPPAHPWEDVQEQIRLQLQDADRRAQEIEKSAYEQGYAQGQKDGFDYGLKSASIVKDQLQELLTALGSLPRQLHRDYREWFLSACLEVARKIILHEIRTDPRILLQLMEKVLCEAEAAANLIIKVNPRDLELLKKHTEFETWLGESDEVFVVKPDLSMKPGSCRLESDIQVIDAGVDTQLEVIREHFAPSAKADTETAK